MVVAGALNRHGERERSVELVYSSCVELHFKTHLIKVKRGVSTHSEWCTLHMCV